MSPDERQAALDSISADDMAKVQAQMPKSLPVYPEDIIEVEFLMNFGFEAYWALYPDKDRSLGISGDEMLRLVTAARKVEASRLYRSSQASFIGAAAAQSKKPSTTFRDITKSIIKESKADI